MERSESTVMQMERSGARELTIPADLSRLPDVRRFTRKVVADFGFDSDIQVQITMAINEAVTNAVEHGSPSTEAEVELRAVDEAGALVVYVSDSGRFVPRMQPRGSMPERGRGMAFMDLLMDEVDVTPGRGGTIVKLVKWPPD